MEDRPGRDRPTIRLRGSGAQADRREVDREGPLAQPARARARSAVVDAGCQRTGDPLTAYFREEVADGDRVWVLERAYRRTTNAPATASGPQLGGAFGFAHSYAGCPACGSGSLAFCSDCRRLGCSPVEAAHYRCWSCGSSGALVSVTIEGLRARDLG